MITPHTHIACTVDTIDVPPPGTVHTISLIVGGQPSNPLPWTVPRMIILTNTTVVAISGMMIIQAADIGLRDNVGSNLNITLYIDSFAIPCLITSDSSSTISCLCSISRVVSSSCGDADIYVRVIDTFALMEAYANVTLLLPSLVLNPAYYHVTPTQGGTVLFDTLYYNADVLAYVVPSPSSPSTLPIPCTFMMTSAQLSCAIPHGVGAGPPLLLQLGDCNYTLPVSYWYSPPGLDSYSDTIVNNNELTFFGHDLGVDGSLFIEMDHTGCDVVYRDHVRVMCNLALNVTYPPNLKTIFTYVVVGSQSSLYPLPWPLPPPLTLLAASVPAVGGRIVISFYVSPLWSTLQTPSYSISFGGVSSCTLSQSGTELIGVCTSFSSLSQCSLSSSSLSSSTNSSIVTCNHPATLIDSSNQRSSQQGVVVLLPSIIIVGAALADNITLPTSGGILTFDASFFNDEVDVYVGDHNATATALRSLRSSSSCSVRASSGVVSCPIPAGVGAGPPIFASYLGVILRQPVSYYYSRPTISSVYATATDPTVYISGSNFGDSADVIIVRLAEDEICSNVSIIIPHTQIACMRPWLTRQSTEIPVMVEVARRGMVAPYAWSGPAPVSPPALIVDRLNPTMIGVVIACVVVIILVVVVALYKLMQQRRRTSRLKTMMNVHLGDVNLTDIVRKEQVGRGEYGAVYKGVWQGVDVAMKTVHVKDSAALDALKSEATNLRNLVHPNIVQFIGLYEDPLDSRTYIITEYLEGGALDSLLKRRARLPLKTLLVICRSITAGMIQLEARNIVHCDLACRNILLNKDHTTVKISDFGLSRKNVATSQGKSSSNLPIKWTAPECLKEQVFTSKSDVWSLGITIWEILSRGTTPYSGMTNQQAYRWISDGNRLEPPKGTPEAMQQCDPDAQPPLHASVGHGDRHPSTARQRGRRKWIHSTSLPLPSFEGE
eukprot:TRINITY_DN5973_c0_g1_i2.p1 TRINITY_DN5973_c0_g1~~TRINITY_DN5973_c0_g1_i2.p1  ORF type:complete len:982 (-),score=154.69 TRINITY_DN5973_c0_g1_i2:101-2938(-)